MSTTSTVRAQLTQAHDTQSAAKLLRKALAPRLNADGTAPAIASAAGVLSAALAASKAMADAPEAEAPAPAVPDITLNSAAIVAKALG